MPGVLEVVDDKVDSNKKNFEITFKDSEFASGVLENIGKEGEEKKTFTLTFKDIAGNEFTKKFTLHIDRLLPKLTVSVKAKEKTRGLVEGKKYLKEGEQFEINVISNKKLSNFTSDNIIIKLRTDSQDTNVWSQINADKITITRKCVVNITEDNNKHLPRFLVRHPDLTVSPAVRRSDGAVINTVDMDALKQRALDLKHVAFLTFPEFNYNINNWETIACTVEKKSDMDAANRRGVRHTAFGIFLITYEDVEVQLADEPDSEYNIFVTIPNETDFIINNEELSFTIEGFKDSFNKPNVGNKFTYEYNADDDDNIYIDNVPPTTTNEFNNKFKFVGGVYKEDATGAGKYIFNKDETIKVIIQFSEKVANKWYNKIKFDDEANPDGSFIKDENDVVWRKGADNTWTAFFKAEQKKTNSKFLLKKDDYEDLVGHKGKADIVSPPYDIITKKAKSIVSFQFGEDDGIMSNNLRRDTIKIEFESNILSPDSLSPSDFTISENQIPTEGWAEHWFLWSPKTMTDTTLSWNDPNPNTDDTEWDTYYNLGGGIIGSSYKEYKPYPPNPADMIEPSADNRKTIYIYIARRNVSEGDYDQGFDSVHDPSYFINPRYMSFPNIPGFAQKHQPDLKDVPLTIKYTGNADIKLEGSDDLTKGTTWKFYPWRDISENTVPVVSPFRTEDISGTGAGSKNNPRTTFTTTNEAKFIQYFDITNLKRDLQLSDIKIKYNTSEENIHTANEDDLNNTLVYDVIAEDSVVSQDGTAYMEFVFYVRDDWVYATSLTDTNNAIIIYVEADDISKSNEFYWIRGKKAIVTLPKYGEEYPPPDSSEDFGAGTEDDPRSVYAPYGGDIMMDVGPRASVVQYFDVTDLPSGRELQLSDIKFRYNNTSNCTHRCIPHSADIKRINNHPNDYVKDGYSLLHSVKMDLENEEHNGKKYRRIGFVIREQWMFATSSTDKDNAIIIYVEAYDISKSNEFYWIRQDR